MHQPPRIYLQDIITQRDARAVPMATRRPKYYTRASVNERLPGGLRAATFPRFNDDGSARWSVYHGYPQDVVGSILIGSDGCFVQADSWSEEMRNDLTAAFAEDA